MTDYTKLIERLGERYGVPGLSTDQVLNRRDRKRRNQRITAGVVGIAVFVAAIWIVASVKSLDRSEKKVVPGASGVTGPAETAPPKTGPTETEGQNPEPPVVEPASIGTVMRSGAGCSLKVTADPIPSGPGRLTVMNDTNRVVGFALFYLDAEDLSFGEFEQIVPDARTRPFVIPPPGAVRLSERRVEPGASGTIVDNFTSGETYAVVCARSLHGIDIFREALVWPLAVVGPILVR